MIDQIEPYTPGAIVSTTMLIPIEKPTLSDIWLRALKWTPETLLLTLKLWFPLFEEGTDTLLIVIAVVNLAAQRLNAFVGFRRDGMR